MFISFKIDSASGRLPFRSVFSYNDLVLKYKSLS